MSDWIRGCVHAAMRHNEAPKFGEDGYDEAKRHYEAVYQANHTELVALIGTCEVWKRLAELAAATPPQMGWDL
jgi:hypothetical protein